MGQMVANGQRLSRCSNLCSQVTEFLHWLNTITEMLLVCQYKILEFYTDNYTGKSLLLIFCTVITSSMCYFCSLFCSNTQLGSRWTSWGKKAAEMQEWVAYPPEKKKLALQKPSQLYQSQPAKLRPYEQFSEIFFSFLNSIFLIPIRTLAQETWNTTA